MINPERVHEIVKSCLFTEEEDAKEAIRNGEAVIIGAVLLHIVFDKAKIEEHKTEIAEILNQLPAQFHMDTGGGWSFLNACIDKDGNQWGEHRDIDALLALGIASGQAQIQLPRDMWKAFPGGMPYFTITT